MAKLLSMFLAFTQGTSSIIISLLHRSKATGLTNFGQTVKNI